MTDAEQGQSYKRWYDYDPLLAEVIELLREHEDALLSQATTFLDKLKETVGDDAVEDYYKRILSERGNKIGRRWYDKDPTLSRAIELLRVAPPESQRQIAEGFLANLREQGLVSPR